MSCSPRDQALLPPSSAEQGFVTARLGRRNSAYLTPASGRQDHTILPSAESISRQRAVDRSQIQRTRPATPSGANAAASTASRPASVTIASRPSVGRHGKSSRDDLGGAGSGIFLQTGLDCPNHIEKSQQISLRARGLWLACLLGSALAERLRCFGQHVL